MLAWLFSPWEAHGLGDRFLMAFVKAATGKELPNGRVYNVVCRKPIRAGIIDIEVQGDGWVLAVENKVDSFETPSQTIVYAKHYRKIKKVVRPCSVYFSRGVARTPNPSVLGH